MKKKRLFFLLTLLCCLHLALSPSPLSAQTTRESQIEQSRRFQTTAPLRDTGTSSEEDEDIFDQSPSTDGDSDLGDQILLKESKKPKLFSVFGGAALFHTNNVALVDAGEADDAFFVGQVGVSYRPQINPHIFGEVTVRQQYFRYDEFRALDFDSFDAGGGITTIIPELGNILPYFRYNYNRLTYAKDNGDGKAGTEFFTNHTFTTGILKTFQFSRAHSLYFGPSALFAISNPQTVERNEFAFLLGYDVNLTRSLKGQLSYRIAGLEYTDRSLQRSDLNQTLNGTLTYSFTEWLSLSSSTSVGFNNSSVPSLNYEFVTTGGNLSLKYDF